MNLESSKILAGGSAKLAGGTGISTMVMAYFQVNAAGIGAMCTVITLIAYLFFQWRADRKTKQSDKNTIEIERLKRALAKIDDRKDNENKDI